MDVSLSQCRSCFVFFSFLAITWLFTLSGCGNRFDIKSERGRRASIDEANYHLSRGECTLAAAAINPLYGSAYETEEVRIIKAATLACASSFNALTLVSNIAGTSNLFSALALSLTNNAGDASVNNFNSAVDVLTQAGSKMNGSQRTVKENSYMVFLQLGVIGSIIRNYGNASAAGAQQTAFAYNPGAVSNLDACTLAAAFSFIEDSYYSSDLNDSTTKGAMSTLTTLCTTYTGGACSAINRTRTICDGANAQSATAKTVVTGVDAGW